jgi:hypothetical protein
MKFVLCDSLQNDAIAASGAASNRQEARERPPEGKVKTTMLKKLGLTGLALAAALTVLGPQVASARDRDDNRYRGNEGYYGGSYGNGYGYNAYGYSPRNSHEEHEWRERQRREWREHERRERARRYYYNRGNAYQNGYYDSYGYWHPYGY